jgi:hypothetical protein
LTDTADDIKPTALGGRTDWVALAKVVVKILAIGIPALLGAYKLISDQIQETKNKAEAGYQFSDKSVKALEKRLLDLELAASRLVEVVGRPPPPPPPVAKKKGKPVPVLLPLLPVKVTYHPRQNPADLDKAAVQIARPLPPAPVPTTDASP